MRFWVGVDIDDPAIAYPWAVVVALWMSAAISGQFALMICNALSVAMVVGVCDALVLILLVSGGLGSPITMPIALVVGLGVHTLLALALSYQRFVRP